MSFCHAVTKMMEKRPQDRFAKWADVKEAIKRAFGPAALPAATSTVVSSMVRTIGALHDVYSRSAARGGGSWQSTRSGGSSTSSRRRS